MFGSAYHFEPSIFRFLVIQAMLDIGFLYWVYPQGRPVIDWFYKFTQHCPRTSCRQEKKMLVVGFIAGLVLQSHHWKPSLVRPVKALGPPLIKVLDRVTLGGSRKFPLHLVSILHINCIPVPVVSPHTLSWLLPSQPDPSCSDPHPLPIHPQNLFSFPSKNCAYSLDLFSLSNFSVSVDLESQRIPQKREKKYWRTQKR